MADLGSAVGQNIKVVISDWMPYLAWAVVPAIISTIKRMKPAWKDKVGDYWPLVAIIIAMMLNTIGIKIKPTDLDLPEAAPPGITLRHSQPAPPPPPPAPAVEGGEGDAMPTPRLYLAAEAPEPVEVVKIVEVEKKKPMWAMILQLLGLSTLGGLAASKAHDIRKQWKTKKQSQEGSGEASPETNSKKEE